MTPLRQRVLDELQRRNLAQSTIRLYLRVVADFARYFHTPPDQLGTEHLRQYHLHLIQDRKLATNSIVGYIAALRFFFVKVLKRPYPELDLPNPKRPKRLPTILSRDEVTRLIGAANTLFQYTILWLCYATAMRRAEVCALEQSHIDSARMMILVRSGKGDRDRDLPLGPKLLQLLRTYWCWKRPPVYLFPGGFNHDQFDRPICDETVWHAVHTAAARAGITKRVSPHTLRHSRATHWLEAGVDLTTIQRLLGHARLEHTTVYLHLSDRHLRVQTDPTNAIPEFDQRNGRRPKP